MEPNVDIQSRFVNALRTQASSKPPLRLGGLLTCPYGHKGRIFQNFDQLLGHARAEHAAKIGELNDEQAKISLRDTLIRAR
jgi:hypothetical protein